jgi:hypothetical protein
MGEVRPLERDELEQVVALHERVVHAEDGRVPSGLLEHFQSIFFDYPGADAELRPLAFVDGDGRITGFIGSSVRRFVWKGRTVRMRISSHLLTDEEARQQAAGLHLVRELLSGAQDFTVTDTSNEASERIWHRLGGDTVYLNSVGWVRLFKPWRFGRAVLSSRRRRVLAAAARPLAAPLDAATVRLRDLRAPRTEGATTELTSADLAAFARQVPDAFELRADYGEEFAGWLYDTLADISGRENLVARAVHRDGELQGWYVYLLKPDGVAETLLIVPTADVEPVLDQLLYDAWSRGAVAVRGRVQAHVAVHLARRRCLVHPSSFRVLVCASEPGLVDAIQAGRALLTRIDADWVYGAWWDVHGGSPIGMPQ